MATTHERGAPSGGSLHVYLFLDITAVSSLLGSCPLAIVIPTSLFEPAQFMELELVVFEP